jgi:hypothetical protein
MPTVIQLHLSPAKTQSQVDSVAAAAATAAFHSALQQLGVTNTSSNTIQNVPPDVLKQAYTAQSNAYSAARDQAVGAGLSSAVGSAGAGFTPPPMPADLHVNAATGTVTPIPPLPSTNPQVFQPATAMAPTTLATTAKAVNKKALGAAGAGAAAGFMIAGPPGAAIGAAIGYLGGNKFFPS